MKVRAASLADADATGAIARGTVVEKGGYEIAEVRLVRFSLPKESAFRY